MKNLGPTESKIVDSLKFYSKSYSTTISGIAANTGLTYDKVQKAVKSLRAKGKIVKRGVTSYGVTTFGLSSATHDKANGVKKATKAKAAPAPALTSTEAEVGTGSMNSSASAATTPATEEKVRVQGTAPATEEKVTTSKPARREYGGCGSFGC